MTSLPRRTPAPELRAIVEVDGHGGPGGAGCPHGGEGRLAAGAERAGVMPVVWNQRAPSGARPVVGAGAGLAMHELGPVVDDPAGRCAAPGSR
jgi:hypothetical protein